MPSTLKKTQHRALSLTRSIATAFKFKIFSDKNPTCLPPYGDPLLIPTKYDISRPRQLRRAPIPHFKHAHFIHEIPIELLAHIFVLGSEDDIMFPIRISHVCRKWRHIALHSPTLWRQITLGPNIDMWKERISRAGVCTLDIHLVPWRTTQWPAPYRQFVDSTTVQWYLQPVTPLLRRWRTLEIVFTEYAPYLWNAALSGCCSRSRRSQAPALQELTLIYRANDDTKQFCLFSGVAPRLRNVTLDGVRLTWLPSLFGNLTFLDYTHHGFSIGHQAVYDVVNMLQVSCRLVELRILFPAEQRPAPLTRSQPVTQRVSLPYLQHLHLRVEGSDIPFELAHLMTLILTPSLSSLRLIDVDHRHPAFPSLKSFFYVYSISPSLRFLRIEHGWYDPRMVTPILSALPRLRQLIIRRSHMPDQVLNLTSRDWKGHRAHDFFHSEPPHIVRVHPSREYNLGHKHPSRTTRAIRVRPPGF